MVSVGVEQEIARTDEASRLANYSNEGSINHTLPLSKEYHGPLDVASVRKELGVTFPELRRSGGARVKVYCRRQRQQISLA